MLRHYSGDNRTYHQGPHIYNPIQCVPLPAVVQEEDVCNDGGHDGFGRSSADSVDHACAHEGVIGGGFGAPDRGTEVYELGGDVNWAAAK